MTTTVVPAYGRTYPAKKAVLKDFDSNKDFTLADFMSRWDGKPCNKADLAVAGYKWVKIRYGKHLTKVIVARIGAK